MKEPELTSSLTWKKKIIFSIVTLLLFFLILELCFRVFFAFYVGSGALLYGTPFHRQQIQSTSASAETEIRPDAKTILRDIGRDEWNKRRTVEIPQADFKGYFKYFPNQKKNDFDVETGQRFEVMINSRGFRGHDFSDKKEPGTIRIVCLGASSTFGYFDKDDQTYPVYLENILNARYPGDAKFEVINLGIPLLRSVELYYLFINEVVSLNPDIVTFYEGSNDSDPPEEWLTKSFIQAGIKRVGRVLMFARFIDSISSRYLKILFPSLDSKEVQEIKDSYIYYISKIYDECKKRGIKFVLANQQKNSQSFDREALKHLTYQEEVAKIKDKFTNTGALLHPELALLIHSVLMKNLEVWAKTNEIPFVDIISRLNHDRDVLVSWVHLSPRGNYMIAEALAEKILECCIRN